MRLHQEAGVREDDHPGLDPENFEDANAALKGPLLHGTLDTVLTD